MSAELSKQKIVLSKEWIIHRNEFYDIDPMDDNILEDDKLWNIYCQEDLFFIQNGQYNIDLGWYGSDDLKDKWTGYMLVLYKGENWNNCELFELIRTKSKSDVVNSINQIVDLVNSDFYNDKSGYLINENGYIGQHAQYSVSKNLNELI